MNRLVMSGNVWRKARQHLLGGNGERFAFFLCGVSRTKNFTSFLVREIILVPDEEIEFAHDGGLQLRLDALLRVTNRAREDGLALVESHSHPGALRAVFSSLDIDGMKEFVPFILKDILGMPYAATVWSEQSIDGRCWKSSYENEERLHEVCIVGETYAKITTTSGKDAKSTETRGLNEKRNTRQFQLIGREGQDRIRQTRAGLVGLGGIGSQIAQQLAYLGVRDFTLVDVEKIDETNLNRLIGSRPNHVGMPKVQITARMIRSISSGDPMKITALEADLRRTDVLKELLEVDVIFGCVDNDGARLILNELSIAYMIPYIDSAAGINVQEDRVDEAGGRVVLVHPDGPCLLCCGEIDREEASYFLASPEEQRNRVKMGYVRGAIEPSPSVVSLNGLIASVAVTEFLALVTRIRPARAYTFYDFLGQTVAQRIVKADPKCVACTKRSMGDMSRIFRYARDRPTKDSTQNRFLSLLKRRRLAF
jgi:molybdopterin/thiamine biosynthesis adenylyltransferase